MEDEIKYGSQSYHVLSCILCDEAGRHVSAFTYCTVCRMYLCERCLTLHHRFPSNRNHHMLDNNQMADNLPDTTSVNYGHASVSYMYSNDVTSTRCEYPTSSEARRWKHEQRANEIEVLRERAGQKEDRALQDLLLRPLNIPTSSVHVHLQNFTQGGVTLCVSGDSGLFKYRTGVYDVKQFIDMIKGRTEEFKRYSSKIILSGAPGFGSRNRKSYNYVIYNARQHGISRQELSRVLQSCQVGNISDIPREEYFRRMRDEIYQLVEDDGFVINVHYRRQMFRWLANISVNLRKDEFKSNVVDPNFVPFAIPDDVSRDVSTLRDWGYDSDNDDRASWDSSVTIPDPDSDTESEESRDFESDSETGDYDVKPGKKDPHDLFVNLCASHVDANIPALNMTIDGDVAWKEIKQNVIKNDETTNEQETILANRALRTKPITPKEMQRKRKQLEDYFECRRKPVSCDNKVEDFIQKLEKSWKEFQKLLNYSNY